MSEEEQLAELLALVLAGRPDRLTSVALAQEPPEVRAAFAMTTNVVASVGLAAEPIAPSVALRDRILRTVAQRRAPRREAFVVVDMIVEHLKPGTSQEVPRARAIVPAVKARLERARTQGIPIVYVIDEHEADDPELDSIDGWGAHAIKGSEGTQVWPDLAPKDGDRIVKKSTYSAFTNSDLGNVLDSLHVDTLVLTGCLTEIGILATATEALQRGFAVEVPPDAQAGSSATTEQVALGLLAIMPPYGPARRARLASLGQANTRSG